MIGTIVMQLFGYGVFAGLLCGICKAHARRWTRVASVYGAPDPSVLDAATSECRRMQTVFLTGGTLRWNSYKGIVTVGVTSAGVWFRVMRPFSLFHTPLVIPYRDIQVTSKQWYLVGNESFQLNLRGVSDVRIVIDDDLLDWMRQQAGSLAEEMTDERGSVEVLSDAGPTGSPESTLAHTRAQLVDG